MERKDPDLEGDIDLSVVLPNTSIVSVTVKRRLPLMDLLVLVSSKRHLKPSEHIIQAISENNTIIRSSPNTPIGALKARYFQILKKHPMEDSHPLPPVAPPRRSVLPNISSTLPPKYKTDVKSIDPQKMLLSYRLQVHLPNNQLHVMRVTADMTIHDVLLTVEDAKNLNINNFSVRNKHDLGTELDYNNTLAQYQIKELILERISPQVPLRHSRMSLQAEPTTSTIKSGVKSFFMNLKLNSGKLKHRSSVSEERLKPLVPPKRVLSVYNKEPVPIPQDISSTEVTPVNKPKRPPRKRHAPPPPMQQVKFTEVINNRLLEEHGLTNGVADKEKAQIILNKSLSTYEVQKGNTLDCEKQDELPIQTTAFCTEIINESAKDNSPKIHLEQISTTDNNTRQTIKPIQKNGILMTVEQPISDTTSHVEVVENIDPVISTSHIVEIVNENPINNSENVANEDEGTKTIQNLDSGNVSPANKATDNVIQTFDQHTEKQNTENNVANSRQELLVTEDNQENVECTSQTNKVIKNSDIPIVQKEVEKIITMSPPDIVHQQVKDSPEIVELHAKELNEPINEVKHTHSSLDEPDHKPINKNSIAQNNQISSNSENISTMSNSKPYSSPKLTSSMNNLSIFNVQNSNNKKETIKSNNVFYNTVYSTNGSTVKDRALINRKPMANTSSELNVCVKNENAPKFLLTSWSSDKVPKVTRIADDSTHGSSAYRRDETLHAIPTVGAKPNIDEEELLPQESTQPKKEQSPTLPTVVSVLRKDPKINNIKSNNENASASKPTSSHSNNSISAPPRIQSWELVNAIEKMFKRNYIDIENLKPGNRENDHIKEIAIPKFNLVPQARKASYFQIIAQSENIRRKIPLKLSEQSIRSSELSPPLVNDYGIDSCDKTQEGG